jgi:hypothetical protein
MRYNRKTKRKLRSSENKITKLLKDNLKQFKGFEINSEVINEMKEMSSQILIEALPSNNIFIPKHSSLFFNLKLQYDAGIILVDMENNNSGRASGQTTRLVDAAIQEFFTKGEAVIKDHYWPGKENMSEDLQNKHIMHLFLRRLSIEHNFGAEKLNINLKKGLVKRK